MYESIVYWLVDVGLSGCGDNQVSPTKRGLDNTFTELKMLSCISSDVPHIHSVVMVHTCLQRVPLKMSSGEVRDGGGGGGFYTYLSTTWAKMTCPLPHAPENWVPSCVQASLKTVPLAGFSRLWDHCVCVCVVWGVCGCGGGQCEVCVDTYPCPVAQSKSVEWTHSKQVTCRHTRVLNHVLYLCKLTIWCPLDWTDGRVMKVGRIETTSITIPHLREGASL